MAGRAGRRCARAGRLGRSFVARLRQSSALCAARRRNFRLDVDPNGRWLDERYELVERGIAFTVACELQRKLLRIVALGIETSDVVRADSCAPTRGLRRPP